MNRRAAKTPTKVREAMRVDAERLDHLIETIGELVIAESMVSQSRRNHEDKLSVKLAKDLDHLDKISRELQEIGMSLRMVPVRPVFQKMARLVRDLAKKQDREVEFVDDAARTRSWTRTWSTRSAIRWCTWSATPWTTASRPMPRTA